MSAKLRLAEGLTLPPEAVTETFGILAVRGAGKSNAAAVMAEEMFKAKLPFVVVDPVRSWWGLRSSSDGAGPGLAVPIFGGRRGDVPLERGAGVMMADLVAEERLSCVLDVSEFDSEAGKKQFLLDFAVRLYRKNEAPLHLFLEEADDYIPQRPMREEAHLLRAWENIVRRGRNRGLGMTLITQRSAAINKSVLTQVQTLIAMRTTGPQDRAAVEEWLKYHHQEREILESLPILKDGEAWVWSPNFLRKTVKVRFRLRATFDSGATPKLSSAVKAPATLADVDLGALQKRMATTIERAKQEDPRELRRQLAEVKGELATVKAAPQVTERRVEVRAVSLGDLKTVERLIERARKIAESLSSAAVAIGAEGSRLSSALAMAGQRPVPERPAPIRKAPVVRLSGVPAHGSDAGLTGPERKLLTALAQHGPRSLTALALLTGYSSQGGAFRNPLSALRAKGYADGRDPVTITDSGARALGSWIPLPTGRDLLDWWLNHLPGPERKLLRAVAEKHPSGITIGELAAATDYEASGGAFRNPLSRLRTLGLVSGRSEVRAAEELFG
jgi:predicted transcriptional regulator